MSGRNDVFREWLHVLFMQRCLMINVLQGGTGGHLELGKFLWRTLRSPEGSNTTPPIFLTESLLIFFSGTGVNFWLPVSDKRTPVKFSATAEMDQRGSSLWGRCKCTWLWKTLVFWFCALISSIVLGNIVRTTNKKKIVPDGRVFYQKEVVGRGNPPTPQPIPGSRLIKALVWTEQNHFILISIILTFKLYISIEFQITFSWVSDFLGNYLNSIFSFGLEREGNWSIIIPYRIIL